MKSEDLISLGAHLYLISATLIGNHQKQFKDPSS